MDQWLENDQIPFLSCESDEIVEQSNQTRNHAVVDTAELWACPPVKDKNNH